MDFLANHHMFTVTEVLASITSRETATDDSKYDEYEEDDIGLSRLLVESKLGEPLREKIRVRYDHLTSFHDLPGPALFIMALDICNVSQSFDIEGAQDKFDELTLDDFEGEDVTACTTMAHKFVKILQSGYAPPNKTGSKLLKKLTITSCEEFNRKVFTHLDRVKAMEKRYQLADPNMITQDIEYHVLGPIGLIAWAQEVHTQLVTDHDWVALAARLPESNLSKS
jgi:hypothetical protein